MHRGDVERREVAGVLAQDVGAERQHDQREDDDRRVVALEEAARARPAPDDATCAAGRLPRVSGGAHGGVDQPLLGDLVAAEGLDDLPARHDDDAVAEPLELLGVRGRDDDRHAAVGDLAQDAVDLRAGADVDALRRLVGEQDGRLRTAARGPARPSAGCRRTARRRRPPATGSCTASDLELGADDRRPPRRRLSSGPRPEAGPAPRGRRSPAPTGSSSGPRGAGRRACRPSARAAPCRRRPRRRP